MTDAILTLGLVAAMFFALIGCGYLAMSQTKHAKAIKGRNAEPANRSLRRLVGWISIVASLFLCILRDGTGFAVLLWPLILASAALVISLAIAYEISWLRFLAVLPGGWGGAPANQRN